MRKVNRARHDVVTTTDLGTKVTTNGQEITLETPKASVIGSIGPKGRDMSWLMRDCLSTEYATIIR